MPEVDMKEECYLTHVLQRALRHYAGIVKAKKPIGEIDDFRALMQRSPGTRERGEAGANSLAPPAKTVARGRMRAPWYSLELWAPRV